MGPIDQIDFFQLLLPSCLMESGCVAISFAAQVASLRTAFLITGEVFFVKLAPIKCPLDFR